MHTLHELIVLTVDFNSDVIVHDQQLPVSVADINERVNVLRNKWLVSIDNITKKV